MGIINSNIKRLGSEFILVLLGQGLSVLGSLVIVKVFTGLLAPKIYGEVALVLTIASMAHLLVLAPFGQGCLRFFSPAKESNELSSYFHAVGRLLLRYSFFVIVIFALTGVGLWMSGHANKIGLLVITAFYSLANSYSSIIDAMQNAARQRALVAWHQAIGQGLRILGVVGLVKMLGASVGVVMLGQTFAVTLVFLSQAFFLHRLYRTELNSKLAAHESNNRKWDALIRKYSWPFILWGGSGWAQSSSDRWALQTFRTSNDVGLYSVLYQIGYSPIIVLSNFMVQLAAPVLFARAGDGSDAAKLAGVKRSNNMIIYFSIALTIFGTILCLFIHDWIFHVLVGSTYQSVSPMLAWMVLAGGLFATGQIAALSLMSGGDTRKLIFPKIGSACLTVILNVAGVYYFNIHGLVIAMIIQSLVYFIWIVIVTRTAVST